VTESVDELGHATTYQFDASGRRTAVVDALGNATHFAYDDAGNQTSVTDANGNSMAYVYDVLNRQSQVVYPDATFEQTTYDSQGNRASKSDQAGLTTQYGYDFLGRLSSVTDAIGGITSYGYDELGNRTSQTDANGHTTYFAFDDLGRRVSRTLPLGQVESFTYFLDGQLKTRTDFNGHTTAYAYEPGTGRLATRIPDAFFATEPPVTWTYSPTGRRHTMTDSTGTTSYSYDNRDRLLSKSTPEGSLTYTYDTSGNRKTVRSDSGAYTVDYGYDTLNRLSTVTDNSPGGGTTTYHYDPASRLSSYDYPNGVTTSMRYDSLNRVNNVALATNGSAPRALASYAYTFYATGNRHTVAELSGRVVTWSYDNLWQLSNESIAGGSANGGVTYGVDAVGNRTSRASSLPGVTSVASTLDADDRLNSDGWDADGNTTSSGGVLYTYDSENRLVGAQGGALRYEYDGDGVLVAKTMGGARTSYLVDIDNPTGYSQVVEDRWSGSTTSTHVYGSHGVISQKDSGGYHYYGWDGHSGVRLLLDGAGAVTDSYVYDAFGNLIGRTGSTFNEHLYRGERLDWDTGLQNLRERWMDPAKGRFETKDTFEGDPDRPITLHSYLYGNASPTEVVDPSGREGLIEAMAVGATVGILSSMAGCTTMPPSLKSPTAVELSSQDLRNVDETELGNLQYGLSLSFSNSSDWNPWYGQLLTALPRIRVASHLTVAQASRFQFAGVIDSTHHEFGLLESANQGKAFLVLVNPLEQTAANEHFTVVHELVHVLQAFRNFGGDALRFKQFAANHAGVLYLNRWWEREAFRVEHRAGNPMAAAYDDGRNDARDSENPAVPRTP